MQLVTHTL